MQTIVSMNNFRLVVVILLSALVTCGNFIWNPLKFNSVELLTQNMGHQASAEGSLYMNWQDRGGKNRLEVYKMTPEGELKCLNSIPESDTSRGYERPTIQVSTTGKTLYVAYFGCKNGPRLHSHTMAPSDCARVFFIESTDEGNSWTDPMAISPPEDYIPPDSSLSMVLERDTGRLFIFYAKRSEKEFSSVIVGYAREPGKQTFTALSKLPAINRLSAFSVGQTVDQKTKKRYLHLVYTDYRAIFYSKSENGGLAWSFYQSIYDGISPNPYNFLAIDSMVHPSSLYIEYRDRNKQQVFLAQSKTHGRTFEQPLLLGASTKPSRDALAICGSKEYNESLVVVAHTDTHEELGFVRVMTKDATRFVDIPYPFKKLPENPISNLMVDCAYKGNSQFHITLAMLVGGKKKGIYFAHGTLKA